MTQVYLLLGGIYSFDGPVTSAGMYTLRSMLFNQISGIKIETYLWASYQSAGDAITKLSKTTNVAVVGYSGGGSHATWMARMKSCPRIDLLIAYDPSPKISCLPLWDNVKRAICYHNTNPLFFGLGGGQLSGKMVETVNISQPHLAVQFNMDLHQRTVNEIKSLG